MLDTSEVQVREELLEIDLVRLDWYDDFFDHHAPDGPLDLARALSWTTFDQRVVPGEATGYPLSESSYWELFLTGYARYRGRGRVTPSNPYVRYLMSSFRDEGYDAGLSPLLASAEATVNRVRRRYLDMDTLATADPHAGVPREIDPVKLVASAPGTEDDFTVPVIGREDRLIVQSFDGYHRTFAARLLGFASLACRSKILTTRPRRSEAGGAQ
jgi:hypothetical protein